MTKSILLLIQVYQQAVSPYLPSRCRYIPTCSHYFQEAINRHGIFRGSQLTVSRLLRCVPWRGSGFDPVP